MSELNVRVPEYDRNAYEELRAIIDGGSETATHADAVEWCKRHAASEWKAFCAHALTPRGCIHCGKSISQIRIEQSKDAI